MIDNIDILTYTDMQGDDLMEKSTAKTYIDITDMWENTDKSIVCDNIDRIFGDGDMLRRNRDATRIKVLSKITSSNAHSVSSWMNRSRENVKVPLLKLCEIADYLHIKVETLLTDRGKWQDSVNLNSNQISIFTSLRENQYFKDDICDWDIYSFVRDMSDLELLDSKEQLYTDCCLYFDEVVGISGGYLNQRIEEAIQMLNGE